LEDFMTVILMTQETGSRGDEVAAGVAECLGVELVHRERLERCIAERTQIDEATVQRIFKDKASLLERWMIDRRRLSRCMAHEVVRLAARGDVLIQTCRVTPLLRLIKHVICVHVCATARSRAAAFLKKAAMMDGAAARDETRQGGATRERMRRRLFGNKCENLEYYDLVINTECIPVAQCVEQVRWLAQSPQFQATAASRAVLASLLQETQQRSTPSSVVASEPAPIAHEVIVNSSRVKLTGVATNEQAIARIEDHLRGENPSTASRVCSLPPAGLLG
jgi:cytidylate kinase